VFFQQAGNKLAKEISNRTADNTQSRIPSLSNSRRRTPMVSLCFRENLDRLLSHRPIVSGLQEIISANSSWVFPHQRRRNEIRPPGVGSHSNGTYPRNRTISGRGLTPGSPTPRSQSWSDAKCMPSRAATSVCRTQRSSRRFLMCSPSVFGWTGYPLTAFKYRPMGQRIPLITR